MTYLRYLLRNASLITDVIKGAEMGESKSCTGPFLREP